VTDDVHDDRALVAAARLGDRAALERLLRRHHDRIFAVCRRMLGNDADALDATQEALVAIVRGLPRFDGRAAFTTWAHRIAVNASLDELRRRARRPVPQEPPGTEERTDDPPLDRAVADRLTLDEALRAVPAPFRAAVILRDQLGLDYRRIAEVLGVPPGTVRSRIARGRALLAARLGNRTAGHTVGTDRP
jgi:RNA polymerase sigma-70 factor (ECF subfamily)